MGVDIVVPFHEYQSWVLFFGQVKTKPSAEIELKSMLALLY